jgi:hypothetical protein
MSQGVRALLEHIGDGRLEPVKPSERRAILDAYKVGDRILCELERARSRQQNKALHAVMAKALANVPEDQSDRWADEEHLRHWCFIRVGFKDTITYPFADSMTTRDVSLLTTALLETRKVYRDKGIYTEIRVVPEGLAWDIPKSWKFMRARHKKATQVFDAVIDLLITEVVPGITREQLLTAVRKDAA